MPSRMQRLRYPERKSLEVRQNVVWGVPMVKRGGGEMCWSQDDGGEIGASSALRTLGSNSNKLCYAYDHID